MKNLYSKGGIIQELFEEQVLHNRGKTAVRYRQKSITYYELNEKANI